MTSAPASLRIGLAQLHLRVGVDDATLDLNRAAIVASFEESKRHKCDVVLAPELALCGYSPEDLLLRFDVQHTLTSACNALTQGILDTSSADDPVLVFGAPRVVKSTDDNVFPQGLESRTTLDLGTTALANAAVVVQPREKITSEIYKMNLPNWGVFDEPRIFATATRPGQLINISGVQVGVVVCRDIWRESTIAELVAMGAQCVLVPNASPYANARYEERTHLLMQYATKYCVPIAYVNMIEGCDEVVFDGGSFVISHDGKIIAETKRFVAGFVSVDVEIPDKTVMDTSREETIFDLSSSLMHDDFEPSETYQAVVLATREFLNATTNGNSEVVIGLSGGIDSALVASIAVDAIGAKHVHGVAMPSRFTSTESNDDAQRLAKNLGISFDLMSIEKMHMAATEEYGLDDLDGVVNENVQARLRGLTLNTMSNARGWLILATSNKSESAVGYCTLYGDTVGAYAPIKDVYKTQVYALANWRNTTDIYEIKNPIPASSIRRAPTAELREDQRDDDSLPSYDILDSIAKSFIDYDMNVDDIIAQGYDDEIVNHVVTLIKDTEFKRKQTPVGPRLTRKNFGKGRRIPIIAKW